MSLGLPCLKGVTELVLGPQPGLGCKAARECMSH